MPKIRKDSSHQHFRMPLFRARNGRSASLGPSSTPMNSKALRTLITIVAMAALSGCQSGPHWAWWKHDAAPDSSATARSAPPALPSAQTTPQAVAVAGLTPAAPPSSANLAAAAAPAAAPMTPPSMSIPLTSSATVANAPQANYPAGYSPAANSLADKLTSSPNAMTKSAATPVPSSLPPASPSGPMSSQPLAAVSTPATAGPYDPKAYKPSSPLTSMDADGSGDVPNVADRYGLSSAAPSPMSMSQPPASTSGGRFGRRFSDGYAKRAASK